MIPEVLTSSNSPVRAVVIGTGTMGGGIAIHLSNLGFQVTLVDVTSAVAQGNLERLQQSTPATFMTAERAHSVKAVSLEDAGPALGQADWVCEAVSENLAIKKSLYEFIESKANPGCLISTNTSGLEIQSLVEGMSDGFKARFVGAHFFNPPRALKLLELIPHESTRQDFLKATIAFFENRVARRVILAKDTPGFIANRFGMWCMFQAIHAAEKLYLPIEDVDAMTGTFLGRPKSGSFRLNDLVGLDVMNDIATHLIDRLPDDPFVATLQTPKSLKFLLDKGWLGEKSGQGYYRRENKELLAFDFRTGAYRNRTEPNLPSLQELATLPLGERIAKALEMPGEVGEFLRTYLIPCLTYADYLRDKVAHSVSDFDRVMQWGFGWELGPFQLIDRLGTVAPMIPTHDRFYKGNEVLSANGTYHPVENPPQYRALADYPVLDKSETYDLRDLGDGVLAVAITTKMGVITPRLVEDLIALLDHHPLDKFVLTSGVRSFSAGYDLSVFLTEIDQQGWETIEHLIERLSHLGQLLERRKAVAAMHGYCLGAGFELAFSCPKVVAHSETHIGLPEIRVGLIPGGRGTLLARRQAGGSVKNYVELSSWIMEGKFTANALEAKSVGLMRATDEVEFHPDRLLFTAKKAAISLTDVAPPTWPNFEGPLYGMVEQKMTQLGSQKILSEYDQKIVRRLLTVLTRSTSEEDMVAKERATFIDLCKQEMTRVRIVHMLEKGKPLRN